MDNINIIKAWFVLMVDLACSYSPDTIDYCINEVFQPKCPGNGMIIVQDARFGFFGIGRCTKFDVGVNCTEDSTSYLRDACNWKNECTVPVVNLEYTEPCIEQIRPYLLAEYKCIDVEIEDFCRPHTIVPTSGISGSIASSVAKNTGCGSLLTPWRIDVLHGQSVSISKVTSKSTVSNPEMPASQECKIIGYITTEKTKENQTICESHNTQPVFTASNENVLLQLLTNGPIEEFLLDFKVNGCVDLLTPEFAWYQRFEDEAVIGCKHRNMTWHLHCEGNRWNGVMGKCHDNREVKTTVQMTEHSPAPGNQLLILIGVIAAIFITLLVCITVAIFKLIDRRNAKQLAKQQILLDSSTSHRYSGGPQRHDPLMYHERIEMVPDILENSLRRTYAPGKADSESSSQTNYPGTLYFMGTLGHNVQSPGVEAIPLPRKPASVSDSESEHLYDSIPADCT